MDDNQKSRLMIIGVAGLLLLGGGGWWVMTQYQNAEKAEQATGIPQEGGPAAGTQIASNPATPAPGDNSANPPATTPANPSTAAPANQGSNPVASNPPASTPANPAPSTPANPAPSPPATPAPSKPAAQPTTPAAANPTTAAPATPLQASKAPPAPPAAPAKPAPPAAAAKPAPPAQPLAQTPPPAPAPATAATPPAIPPANALPTPPAPAGTTSVVSSKRYPATRREEAIIAAKQVAGREDPMFGTFEKTPYPAPWTKIGAAADVRTTAVDEKEDRDKAEAEKKGKNGSQLANGVVPPPPPPGKMEKPVPPPPPSNLGGVAGGSELPPEILPPPPDKPLVTPQLKLTAILGNKAVLSVPLTLRSANKWPAVICLGPGEKFEDPDHGTFSVVQVDRDSVTIEEDQERSVKSLPQIK